MLKKCKWIVTALILILLGSVSAQAENTLVLPAGTTEIQAQAFYGDTAIGEVKLPEGLLRIESQAFAESSVTKINLPSSLAFIAEDAFKNCNGLDHVAVQAGTYAYTRAHEIGLFDLRAVISGNIEAAIAGENIVWTAKAMNGVAPYKYLFEVYRNGEKIDSRAYTAEDSYAYQFTRSGEYYAIVKIKDDDGNVASAKSAIVTVTANAPVIESVNCNLSEIKTTEEVRWTVLVKNGTAPYTYAFALNQGDQVVAESENSIGEYSFTFEDAGDYTLSVTVTDAYQESASCILPLSVSLTPVSIQNISCSHETLVADTAITWTVNATAGVKPYAYSYEILSGSEVLFAAADQTANTCSYTFEASGEYTLSVIVKDAEGNTASYSVALSVAPRVLEIVGVDYKPNVELGNDITWTVNAVGGDKPLRYAFDLYQDGEEIDGAAFGESNSFTFNPTAAGKYSVRIRVRDQQNTTVEMTGCETNVYIATAEEYFTYSVSSEKATVTGYTGTATEVYIPATIGGYPVTRIGNGAFAMCKSLTSVVIPNGVMYIEGWAFNGCSNLTSVILPDSVTRIDGWTFRDCNSLISITIPSCVTEIDDYTFEGCSSLRSVTIPEGVTDISIGAFDGCKSLISITLPDSVSYIGSEAFRYCSSLTSITLPVRATFLGGEVFRDCNNLTSVTIPDGVTSIGNFAFYRCSSLTSVTIPDSVTSIGNYAFYYCSSLTSVMIPAGVTNIGYSAFYGCSSLTSVTIPEGITSIGNSTFSGCSSLTSVNIPEGVTSIGNYAFYNCSSLTSVNIPAGVTSIGGDAFGYCSSLTSVMIPEGTTSIGNSTFSGCSSLTSITIPASVTSIEDYAFGYCSSLTSITIPASVTSIGRGAFSYCRKLTSITIPDGVTVIEANLFYECTNLKSVVLPSDLTAIGDYAFLYCRSLTSLTIPASVTSIGSSALLTAANMSGSTFTVFCYEGSYAHTYCINNNVKYQLIRD